MSAMGAAKVSFGTDVLVHATDRRLEGRQVRARDVMGRAMFAGSGILLLGTLVEFCEKARGETIPERQVRPIIKAWSSVLPVQLPIEDDFWGALDIWDGEGSISDALLWASARRAGVTHILTAEASEGAARYGIAIIDPFDAENDHLVDQILPAA